MYFDHLYKMPDGPCSKVELPYSWRPETPWTRMFAQHSGIPARGPPGSGLEAWHLSTPETTIQKPLQPPAGASVPPIAVGYRCSHLDQVFCGFSKRPQDSDLLGHLRNGRSQTFLEFAKASHGRLYLLLFVLTPKFCL